MDNVVLPISKLAASIHSSPSAPRSPLRTSVMSNASPLRKRYTKLAGAQAELSPILAPGPLEDAENMGFQAKYVSLYNKHGALIIEHKQMHDELQSKKETIEDLRLRLSLAERALRQLETDYKLAELAHQEDLACYRRSLEELQHQTQCRFEQANQDLLRTLALYQNLDEKYAKLLRSYKALQSNLELEQNLKALLIDQIEHLTKERDILLSQVDPNLSSVSASDHDSLIFNTNKRHLLGNVPRDMQRRPLGIYQDLDGGAQLQSPLSLPNLDSDSDGSVHASHHMSSFVEGNAGEGNFSASSPIKNASSSSIEVSQNFHFPTSGETSQNNIARNRNSLPPRIETLVVNGDDRFVPSPLKLTRPSSAYLEGNVSLTNSASDHHISRKRSSYPKPHHSRMNSLDLLPIKVEFEAVEQHPRSASSPDRNFLQHLDSVAEAETGDNSRDLAFMKLNGFVEPNKRDSMLTSSSKRSSLLTDFNILSGDITKQEITKLKFELQSLRLHNEKLLSYIGFELQKQKKNIKKLSSKQRLRPLSVEYSDAKLIERLKDMLIHKKRVLRLVSINPILSTKYDSNGHLFQTGLGLGVPTESPNIDEGDEFVFRSLFIGSVKGDCDDYGFLNHQSKHNLRILSDQDQEYLHETDEKLLKKYKSQTFRRGHSYEDTNEESDLLEEEDFIEEDQDGVVLTRCSSREWDTNSEQSSSGSDVNYSQLNRFNQMKYIVLGKEHMKRQKRRKDDIIIDENLKYKFLTLVVGIVIVGFRFTSHTQLQLQGS